MTEKYTRPRLNRTTMIEMVRRIRHRVSQFEDHIINEYFTEYGTRIAFAAYAFVFFYYGLLKVIPGVSTPVQMEVAAFMQGLGVPSFAALFGLPYSIKMVMLFIGLYEMTLGTLFATRQLRAAFVLFFVHQLVTLTTLIVAPEAYFQRPFLQVAGFGIPWLFDAFAAYVLKNTIFIAGFLILVSLELGREPPKAATHENGSQSPSSAQSNNQASTQN